MIVVISLERYRVLKAGTLNSVAVCAVDNNDNNDNDASFLRLNSNAS
jgi:hypothetical protein